MGITKTGWLAFCSLIKRLFTSSNHWINRRQTVANKPTNEQESPAMFGVDNRTGTGSEDMTSLRESRDEAIRMMDELDKLMPRSKS